METSNAEIYLSVRSKARLCCQQGPTRTSVCFRAMSRVPAAQEHMFSWLVEAFCAHVISKNDGTSDFGDVQCTNLIEIYLSMRSKARFCDQWSKSAPNGFSPGGPHTAFYSRPLLTVEGIKKNARAQPRDGSGLQPKRLRNLEFKIRDQRRDKPDPWLFSKVIPKLQHKHWPKLQGKLVILITIVVSYPYLRRNLGKLRSFTRKVMDQA